MAGWPCLPALWRNGPRWPSERQGDPSPACKVLLVQRPFTVRIGSIFEDSHLPLQLWLQVIHLICRQQERHLDAPTPAHAQLQHEDGVVSWPPYSCGHGARGVLARWAALARSWKRTKPNWPLA